MMRLTLILPVLLLACAPVPEEIDPIGVEPVVEGSSGLQERLPDTCKLANYEGYVGQPVNAAFIPPEANTRVVQPGEILSQVYVANRVNFYVDGNGTITRVICG